MTVERILVGLSKLDPDRIVDHRLLDAVEEHWVELKPSFWEALQEIANGKMDEGTANIAFVGMHYFAQFQDKTVFPILLSIAHLDENSLDFFLGSALTEEFKDILYYTYNGQFLLLTDLLYDERVQSFAKGAVLDVCRQLWLDETLSTEEWSHLLLDLTERVSPDITDFYTMIIDTMTECHLVQFLNLIREKINSGLIDLSVCGDYAEHVDIMFSDEPPKCIHKPFNTKGELGRWYSISGMETMRDVMSSEETLDKLTKAIIRQQHPAKVPVLRAGRNDPCPCGSGKKYKQCCLRKDEAAARIRDEIEPFEWKMKYLKDYPRLSFNPVTGQKLLPPERAAHNVYLEDYFDQETIMTDALVYLGLYRIPPIEAVAMPAGRLRKRKAAYLIKAWTQFVKQYWDEGSTSLDEYDKGHMIHYASRDWIVQLLNFLRDRNESSAEREVEEFVRAQDPEAWNAGFYSGDDEMYKNPDCDEE